MNPVRVYHKLFKYFGRQYWWPADTPFEVIVGAFLTQQTNWSNVEKAIDSLKRYNLLDVNNLAREKRERIEKLIRPVGFYRQKAKKLISSGYERLFII